MCALPPFSICVFELYSICMLRHLERIWLYCVSYIMYICYARVPVNHTPSKNEHVLNLTDLRQICCSLKPHTETESPMVNMISYSSPNWCEWILKTHSSTVIYKKMFFRSWGGHDNLVTDSRSVFRLQGLTALTQRKWAGLVISGTWSKARRWPRLAWQESIQDHWGQCEKKKKKKCVEKTASFPCASPKASYSHVVKMNASQEWNKETRKERPPLENLDSSLKI